MLALLFSLTLSIEKEQIGYIHRKDGTYIPFFKPEIKKPTDIPIIHPKRDIVLHKFAHRIMKRRNGVPNSEKPFFTHIKSIDPIKKTVLSFEPQEVYLTDFIDDEEKSNTGKKGTIFSVFEDDVVPRTVKMSFDEEEEENALSKKFRKSVVKVDFRKKRNDEEENASKKFRKSVVKVDFTKKRNDEEENASKKFRKSVVKVDFTKKRNDEEENASKRFVKSKVSKVFARNDSNSSPRYIKTVVSTSY